jgi:hypothetical protein
MTESEFWDFLNEQRAEGANNIWAASIQKNTSSSFPASEYLTGHALLPKNYEKIPEAEIVKMGALLFRKDVKNKTKEAVLMLLAHSPLNSALSILREYNKNPDEKLWIFSQMALDECEMWNED